MIKLDGFEERAAETLDIRADDLVAQAVGIDDGAAFESGDRRTTRTLPSGVDSNFRGRWPRNFPSRCSVDAEAASCCFARGQPKFLAAASRTARRRASSRFLKAKFQRIDFGGVREGVHVGFAGEMIRVAARPR